MVGYVSPLGYGLIDNELYMPEKWFEAGYADLRKKCGVPASLKFQTKNEMASDMIRKAVKSGLFPAKYVGADSSYGCDGAFLDSLPEGIIYFANVRKDQPVFASRPGMVLPPYSGRGKKPWKKVPEFPQRTVKEIAEDTDLPWNNVVLDIGAKGPNITYDRYLRVTEVRDKKPGKDVWLYIRKLSDGSIKYALCNEPEDASAEDLRRLALMRWSIEQCFHECKEYLGMDHYETRSWAGWRRHILLCFIAHLFTIKLRMLYSCNPKSPGPTPYIDDPVPLDDYLDAAVEMVDNREISHPSISAIPTRPQQVMTIGLVRALVEATFVKFGMVLDDINYYLSTSAQAFESHSRCILAHAFAINSKALPSSG
jgi:SRSO17 transposase